VQIFLKDQTMSNITFIKISQPMLTLHSNDQTFNPQAEQPQGFGNQSSTWLVDKVHYFLPEGRFTVLSQYGLVMPAPLILMFLNNPVS